MGTMRCNYQRSLCFANFADAIRLNIPFTNFREAFKLFDRNRDGFIDMRELKKVDKAIHSDVAPDCVGAGDEHAGHHAHQGGARRVHEGGRRGETQL